MLLEHVGEIQTDLITNSMAEQPRNSNPIQRIHTPVHTIRRTDMIALLTNLRTEVDRAIHNMPGVLLGVSFASVIQASMHLNWQIEYLKGSLIETMVHERHNPFPESEVGERPVRPRTNHSVDNILQRPDSPPIMQAHVINGNSTPESRMEHSSILGPRSIRRIRNSNASASSRTPSDTVVSRNQMISVPSTRRIADNAVYYYGDIANRTSNASLPPVTTTNGTMTTDRLVLVRDVGHYPEAAVTSEQNRPSYGAISVEEFDV